MKYASSLTRKASARLEALEQRKLFSGEIDHSFGDRGRLDIDVAGNPNTFAPHIKADAMTTQSDGKILVAGESPGSATTAIVTRYLANGAVDTTFGVKGYATVKNIKASYIDNISVLSNGKILVGGANYFRLTSAGALDTTYGGGDGVANSYLAGNRRAKGPDVIQADGSVLELSFYLADGKDRVYKYKADGSLDTSFGSGGNFNLATVGNISTGGITTDSTGRIYVSFVANGGNLSVVRLTAAGKLDTTWGKNGVATGQPTNQAAAGGAIAVLADGRVLATCDLFNDQFFTTAVNVFSAAGVNQGFSKPALVSSQLGYKFEIDSIKQAKDGSVYYGGKITFDEIGNDVAPSHFSTYTVVMHLTKNLTVDTAFSADRDGIGGFYTFGQGPNVKFINSAFTSAGDVLLLGRDENGLSTLVRLDSPSKATNITIAQYAAGKLTITGSDKGQNIALSRHWRGRIGDESVPSNFTIDLDSGGTVHSVDRLFYLAGTALPFATINVNGGDDYVQAQYWTNPITINGGDGNDLLIGSNAASVINGGAGNDGIYSGDGNDTLHGDAGDDDIAGIYGDDKIYGDDGNDTLNSGPGKDSLYGGNGNDTLELSGAYSGAYGDGGANTDTAILNGYIPKVITLINVEKKEIFGD